MPLFIKQYKLLPAMDSDTLKVTIGLTESNRSLLQGL